MLGLFEYDWCKIHHISHLFFFFFFGCYSCSCRNYGILLPYYIQTFWKFLRVTRVLNSCNFSHLFIALYKRSGCTAPWECWILVTLKWLDTINVKSMLIDSKDLPKQASWCLLYLNPKTMKFQAKYVYRTKRTAKHVYGKDCLNSLNVIEARFILSYISFFVVIYVVVAIMGYYNHITCKLFENFWEVWVC